MQALGLQGRLTICSVMSSFIEMQTGKADERYPGKGRAERE